MMAYVPRHPPWQHQQQALNLMEDREAFALLMAMRTGKTKTLLDDWGRLEAQGECDDLLVVAPAGVYRTWETAAKDHLSPELLARTWVHTWEAKGTGTKANQKKVDFLINNKDRPRILLVNVEALSSVERARQVCIEFLGQRRSMLVIDESTTIKNPSAKRTKFINRQLKPRANWRRILSGLPTPKSPLDLFSQFEFLDPSILGFKSYYGFKARYAITRSMQFGGRMVPIVVGFRDLDELQEKTRRHSFRVQLEDCYDLPPKIYMKREVELTDEQTKLYKEIKEFATSQLSNGDHVTTTQVITQILRMHQVLCGHVGTEDGKFVEVPEKRTKALLDLLEEHEGKAIIWCSYDYDVRKVAAALEDQDRRRHSPSTPPSGSVVARFWGGNRSSREDEERRFLQDPGCRYMVATAAAGGRGRTWTVADLVVYYSNTADLEHRSQSEERAQGVDKAKSVAYVDLVAPGTVDEKMLKTLRAKINMAAAISGDAWKEWLV